MLSVRSKAAFLIIAFSFISQHVTAQYELFEKQLKKNAVSLDTLALATGNPFDLNGVIGSNFKVLAIGEQSHGTSEFFKARVSLIKSLIDKGSVNKIGLEAPVAEVEKLNVYIAGGQGDLNQILASFRLFNYESQEFTELVESVKTLSKSANKAITFFGIDMQTPFQSLQNILESCLSVNNATADSVLKLTGYYHALDNEMYNHAFSEGDFTELTILSDHIFKQLEDSKAACLQTTLIQKSITSYRQFLQLNNPKLSFESQANLRDSLMAENVLQQMKPHDKIIVLAHNGHVQKTPNSYSKSMGFFLSKKLGIQYQCIALTTSSGFYTAFTPKAGRITDKNVIPAADNDTFEYQFSKTGKPVFLFKTSAVRQKVGNSAAPVKYKLLPFGLTDKPFVTGNLLDDFDYVIHIERTTGNQSFYLK